MNDRKIYKHLIIRRLKYDFSDNNLFFGLILNLIGTVYRLNKLIIFASS